MRKIPKPKEVDQRIIEKLEKESNALLDLCIVALETTVSLETTVFIPEETPSKAVDMVISQLKDAGWKGTTRVYGVQTDARSKILIRQ